nr:interferon-induced protein 44-like [Misgurnus anguillicaudatus]
MANSPPLLDSPWRSMEWSDEKKKFLLEKFECFRLGNSDVNTLRILLHGPVGAGKSSFFNSVDSALKGRITGRARADSMAGTSFTMKPKIYKLKMEETTLPIELIDTRGMENESGIGMKIDDIVRILQGHFENESDQPKNAEKNKPLKDKIHCLVSVLPANNISIMGDDVIIQMRNIRLKARDFGIPQAMIVTKVDEACPEVQKNIKNIYSSRKIKQKMEECCQRLGVPMSYIYPVKNYHEEQTTNTEMDILILQAMLNIVNFAKDYVDDQRDS